MPFEIKRDVIEGLGVQELVIIPFDKRLLDDRGGGVLLADPDRDARRDRASPWGRTSASASSAKGDPEMLRGHAEFETRVVPLVEVDGETVSSTRIRAQVAAGDVEGAMRCLGAPFLLEGTVVEGDKRGRTLGFPTANVVPVGGLRLPRARRLCGVCQRDPRRGQRRRAPDLRDRARAC